MDMVTSCTWYKAFIYPIFRQAQKTGQSRKSCWCTLSTVWEQEKATPKILWKSS